MANCRVARLQFSLHVSTASVERSVAAAGQVEGEAVERGRVEDDEEAVLVVLLVLTAS